MWLRFDRESGADLRLNQQVRVIASTVVSPDQDRRWVAFIQAATSATSAAPWIGGRTGTGRWSL